MSDFDLEMNDAAIRANQRMEREQLTNSTNALLRELIKEMRELKAYVRAAAPAKVERRARYYLSDEWRRDPG